jgi:hypothetical protein
MDKSMLRTIVSEKYIVSIFRAEYGDMFVCNVSIYPPVYTVSNPERHHRRENLKSDRFISPYRRRK